MKGKGKKMIKVKPVGSLDSKVAFIGEAPANKEIQSGEPFVGKSGEYFNNYINYAGLKRNDCYITNVFKMKVYKTKKYIKYGKINLFNSKDKIFTSEGLKHVESLRKELEKVKANVIIPLGNTALSAISKYKGITKYRGSILWSDVLNKKIVPTIHPASIMRMYTRKYWFIFDVQRAVEESKTKEISVPKRNYLINYDFNETVAYLKKLRKEKKKVAFDIEVLNTEVSMISFCNNELEAISIPFIRHRKNYFSLEEEREVWIEIKNLLEDESVRKIGQNLVFDIGYIFAKYGIITKNYDDTMIAHKLLFPDYPAGLDFITSMRTREPYYKDDGKINMNKGVSDEAFQVYNAKDSIVPVIALPSIIKDLKRINNIEAYETHLNLIEPAIYMGQRGLKVDRKRLEKAKVRVGLEIEELQEELNQLVGQKINPRSKDQVATYFYIKKKIKPYKKNGRITTNKDALKRIARKGYKEAKIILDIRTKAHDISTYFNVKLKDGRLCCSYKPVTKMGRFSSSKDILGYGTNMQNQPARMKEFFIADKGHLIYNIDLAQADNRSVGYMGPEYRMIKVFENGEDIHATTAALIFDKSIDEIKQMKKEGVKADIGYGDKPHRYWGKQCNHAFNFGRGPKTFSFDLEIPEKEGKLLWQRYHQIYTGVQHGYHKWIQAELRKNRTLSNCFGRKYRFVERWGQELFKQAYAFPAQSNTADVINRHGVLPVYYELESCFKPVDLLRQVHDSIEFQIPISIGLEEHVYIIKRIKEYLEQTLRWKDKEFIIPADVECGRRLSDVVEIDFSKDVLQQIKKIEKDSRHEEKDV